MKVLSILALIGIISLNDVVRAELAEEDVDNMTEAEYKNYLMRQQQQEAEEEEKEEQAPTPVQASVASPPAPVTKSMAQNPVKAQEKQAAPLVLAQVKSVT